MSQSLPAANALRLTTPAVVSVAATAPMVLHVRVVTGSGGGPEKTILRSGQYVHSDQYRMGAAYLYPRGDDGIERLRRDADARDMPFFAIPESGAVDAAAVRTLLHLCRRHQVRVWHAHDYKSNLLGLLLRRFHPMALVTTAHGWTWDTRRTRLYYRVDNFCLPRYQQVFAVSPRIAEHCLRVGVPEERLTFLPNGIEPAEYQRQHTRDEACLKYAHDPGHTHLGVVGRLSKEKGVDRAIIAFAVLHRRYPNARLHLIGDGPERNNLTRLADRLGVAAGVTFWGWQTELPRIFEMLDLLLLPSLTEGWPNVVMEAMAMHVPVAATDVGGVRVLLDDGRCGLILPDDVTQWPQQLAPLVVSSRRRDMLATRAKTRVTEQFRFDNRMARIVESYDQLLQRSSAVAPDTATTAATATAQAA